MELPLADEIRAARRSLEASAQAEDHLGQVQAHIASLTILERQLSMSRDLELDVPGDALVEELAERWPGLEDLVASGPRPSQSCATRMRLRREQMEAALQVLRPLAGEAHDRGHALQHLQEKQRQLMTGPEFAAVREELSAWHAERGRLSEEVGPLYQRQAMLQPALHLVGTFTDQLSALVKGAEDAEDPAGVAAWRALAVASNAVSSLASVLPDLGLTLPLPPVPALPDQPNAAERDAVLGEARRTLAAFEQLRAVLTQDAAALAEQIDARMTRYAELSRSIQDLTG